MFHVRLVASWSAQEVLCQRLGVAQALAERDVEERKRLQDDRSTTANSFVVPAVQSS